MILLVLIDIDKVYKLSLPLHPVQFTECGHISLFCDPSSVFGWDWLACGVNCDYVSYIIF